MAELSNELNQTLKKIKKLVEEELENDGYTISELEKKFRKTFILDKEQKPKRNEKRWHKKENFDKVLADKLGIKEDDFPKHVGGNNLFSATIARSISILRKKGKIIDAKYGHPRYGIWRKSLPNEEKAIMEFRKGDYSWPENDPIAQKIKNREFTNKLLKNYERKCCVCKFKDQENLSAVNILDYEIMKDYEPINFLNPSNGLLMCGVCENAFLNNIIKITESGDIVKTKKFIQLNEYHLDEWKKRIENNTEIFFPKKDFPDKRFLKFKMKLK